MFIEWCGWGSKSYKIDWTTINYSVSGPNDSVDINTTETVLLKTDTLPAGTYLVFGVAGFFTGTNNTGDFLFTVKTSEGQYGAQIYYDNAGKNYQSPMSTGGQLTLAAPGTISLVAKRANSNTVNLPKGRGFLQVVRVS